MDRSIGWALALAAALGLGLGACMPASALPIHLPGRKARAVVPANEGAWIVHAGATQDLYANLAKTSRSLQANVCTRGPGLAAPRVELQVVGRAPIDIQGCTSLYLLLGPGERLSILNPNPADVSGTYKLDLQAQLK